MGCIGIDLGTTYSVLAHRGAVRLVDAAPAVASLPSVVAFPPSGEVLVGPAARARYARDPYHSVRWFKRLLGVPWDSPARVEFEASRPYALERDATFGVAFDTRGGYVSARTLSAAVLSELAIRAGVRTTEHRAVVAVPASFDAMARSDTRAAALEAGFREVALVEEPIAVASAYAAGATLGLRRVLVYDWGGGGFTCAVLDCSRRPAQVVAQAGDCRLGGEDLDVALARHVVQRVVAQTGFDLGEDPRVFAAVVRACERAKVALAGQAVAELPLGELELTLPSQVSSFPLSRRSLLQISRPWLRRTLEWVDHVLDGASLRPQDLQAVLLSGGGACLAGVTESVAGHLRQTPRLGVEPAHAVAIGAGQLGESREVSTNPSLKERA